MGCDIHMYVEYQDPRSDKWYSTSLYNAQQTLVPIYCGRWYYMFGLLASGVRFEPDSEPCIGPAKGLPEDVSEATQQESNDWGEDGHSHSWCTLKELQDIHVKHRLLPKGSPFTSILERVDKHLDTAIPWQYIRPEGPENIRLVYWFDN